MKLRILSWNVHGLPSPFSKHRAQRLRRIAAQIATEKPDLLALQEVWAGSLRLLLPSCPGYAARFVRARNGGASGGLLLLVREGGDWTIDEHTLRFRRFSHYAPRHRVWEADGLAGKGAAFLCLDHRADRGRLWLVNTHLQSRYRSNAYVTVRRAQLHELGRWVHELGESAPVVLAGDFNTPADGDPLYEGVASLGVDVTAGSRRRGDVTHHPAQSAAGWIDYVLVRPPAGGRAAGRTRLIENVASDDPYSDHAGLVADVEVERRSGRMEFDGVLERRDALHGEG